MKDDFFGIIVIASGKSGIGKSTATANLAIALTKYFSSIGILDANFFKPVQHILFGVDPPLRWNSLLQKNLPLQEYLCPVNEELWLLAADQHIPREEFPKLFSTAIEQIKEHRLCNLLLIDTCSELSPNLIQIIESADILLILTTDEALAIVDTYGLIKFASQNCSLPESRLIVNMTIDNEEAQKVEKIIADATEKFLGFHIPLLGFIPYDRALRQSIFLQKPILLYDPFTATSQAFTHLGMNLAQLVKHTIAKTESKE